MTRHRLNALALLALASMLGACSSDTGAAASCSDDAQCPAASRCQGSTCVADTPPVASAGLPAEAVTAHALVSFDGSASSDPDSGDSVSSYAWTFRSLTAPCDPPVASGSGPVALVRFACQGRYEASLEVRDELGVASRPAVATLEVAPFSGTPVVLAGADLAVEHACSGDPLVCASSLPIALSATTALEGVSLRWTVVPPADRPLGATRRVVFTPSDAAASTAARIEADAGAISGGWIFRVEARDEYGVVGSADTLVTVGNRAPVVAASPPSEFAHSFDPVGSRFVSTGAIDFQVTDPDGDPLAAPETIFRHLGDGQGTFRGSVAGGQVTLAIQVPYAVRADALYLIGGAGLQRTVELSIRDVNGGVAQASWPVLVANRPPGTGSAGGSATIGHSYDVAGSRYVARAQLDGWTDPDGDPLFAAEPGPAPCETITFERGVATVECSAPFTGTPAANAITVTRTVPIRATDPWALASTAPALAMTVTNRAPTLSFAVSDSTAYCTSSEADCYSDGVLIGKRLTIHGGTFKATPIWNDPDGDPISLHLEEVDGSVSPTDALCVGESCVVFTLSRPASITACPNDTWARWAIGYARDGAAAAVRAEAKPPGC